MNTKVTGLIALGALIFFISIALIMFLIYSDDYDQSTNKSWFWSSSTDSSGSSWFWSEKDSKSSEMGS